MQNSIATDLKPLHCDFFLLSNNLPIKTNQINQKPKQQSQKSIKKAHQFFPVCVYFYIIKKKVNLGFQTILHIKSTLSTRCFQEPFKLYNTFRQYFGSGSACFCPVRIQIRINLRIRAKKERNE